MQSKIFVATFFSCMESAWNLQEFMFPPKWAHLTQLRLKLTSEVSNMHIALNLFAEATYFCSNVVSVSVCCQRINWVCCGRFFSHINCGICNSLTVMFVDQGLPTT